MFTLTFNFGMLKFYTLLILVLYLFCKCKNDKFKPPIKPDSSVTTEKKNCGDLSKVSYSAQVQPIINSNCITCHDATTGFKLTDYSQVILFANSGQLTGCLTGDQSFLQMPPDIHMDSCSVKAVVNWVQQGKLNN